MSSPAERLAGGAGQPNGPPGGRRAIVAIGCALAACLVVCAGAPMYTCDAFWHVATGAYVVEHGLFPAHDPFSFTAGNEDWVLHEWLTQVLFWAVHRPLGMWGLRALTAAFAALILWLCARLYRRELGTGAAATLGVIAFTALGAARIQTRPTLLTITALLLLVSMWSRRGAVWRRRDAVAVVLLQWAWSNAHSVALLGPVLYAVFLVGLAGDTWLARRGGLPGAAPAAGSLRRHALTWVAATLTTLATPAGPQLWAFAWQDKQTVMQYVVDEWEPFHLAPAANPGMAGATWLAVITVGGMVLVTWLVAAVALNGERDRLRSPRLPPPSRVLLVLALFAGGLLARRFLWLHTLALLFCLQILQQLARPPGGMGVFVALRARFARRLARAATVALATLAAFGTAAGTLAVDTRPGPQAVATAAYWTQPVAAPLQLPGVAFLGEAGLEGNVACHYNSGGMLTYALYPRCRVSIDSRIDLYRRALFLDYLAVLGGRRDQQQILDRQGADLYYRHWGLPRPVDVAAWIPVWRGPEGDLWLRRGAPRTAANLERARAWHERRALPFPAGARAVPAPSPR